MKMAYHGRFSAVDVPSLGTVQRGEPVEVDNERTARALKRQGWKIVKEVATNGDSA